MVSQFSWPHPTQLNKKVYDKEKVLGWFTTQTKIGYNHAQIQKYYADTKQSKFFRIHTQLGSPLILTLDPTIENGTFDMRVSDANLIPWDLSDEIFDTRGT